jgi:hypothetical protein
MLPRSEWWISCEPPAAAAVAWAAVRDKVLSAALVPLQSNPHGGTIVAIACLSELTRKPAFAATGKTLIANRPREPNAPPTEGFGMNRIRELPQCDVVMKGGITSGVVYPRLIARLARDYRFRSIGGTSAGAIAAAACAAAELGRQSGRVPDAFERLQKLPTELGHVAEGNRHSRLSRLFRPAEHLRAHHAVLLRALNQRSMVQTLRSGLGALLPRFWPLLALGLLLTALATTALVAHLLPGPHTHAGLAAAALVLLWSLGVCIAGFIAGRAWNPPLRFLAFAVLALALPGLSAVVLHAFDAVLDSRLALAVAGLTVVLPLGLLLAVTLAIAHFAFSLLGGLHRNNWGLCSGHDASVAGTDAAALTDWLHGYLNDLAGWIPRSHCALATFGAARRKRARSTCR